MTENEKRPDAEAISEVETGDQPEDSQDQPAEDDGSNDRIARLEAEAAEMKDKALRAMAEAENVRRRADRDREETSKYAVSGFARDLLSVADNLRRALDSLPDHLRGNEELTPFITGVEMTEKELLTVFEKHGIQAIDAEGEKFDPNLHQAMFELESAEHPPGTVVQVVQTGYVIKDRLLRPAMVGVARIPSGDQPGGTVDTSA